MTLGMAQMVSVRVSTRRSLCVSGQRVGEVLLPVMIDGVFSPSVTRLDEKMT